MKLTNKKRLCILLAAVLICTALVGCGSSPSEAATTTPNAAAPAAPAANSAEAAAAPAEALAGTDAPILDGLTFLEETPLQYAQCFRIFRYEGGYSYISIPESGEFLIVPEKGTVPGNVPESVAVLQKPLDRIYLAATSAMALFDAVDAVDFIRMSGTQASGWYIDSAVDALESGAMLFAGRYSEPDYERLIGEDCCLAIESTMIYHTPKVKEMLEDLGIPVMVDRSSYEPHPLGRTEWIKLYAVLTGKENEADKFFAEQAQVIERLKDFSNTEKNVAYFYVNSDGSVVIRSPSDYIPKMIEIAGGLYSFRDLVTEETNTSFSITMESFYAVAADADYLIYNGSIDSPIQSIDELIAKDSLFRDFKAVQNGNVWCSGKSFYQATDIVGQMIQDIHLMLTTGNESEMTFLSRVN